MAIALIHFAQGANTDAAGKAVLGVHGDFSAVTISNDDNTGVVSWKIYMLDAPPDSTTFPPGDLPAVLDEAGNNTPTVDFAPDVAGTYRVMLEVVDNSAQVDRDIRCFGVPDARGFLRPPYQENPSPLPVALPPAIPDGPRPVKPDEQNYGDNVRGWAGNGAAGQIDAFLRRYDDLPQQTVGATPFSAAVDDAPLYIVDLPTIGGPAAFNLPDAPRTGYVVRIAVGGAPDPATPVTIVPGSGGSIGSNPTVNLFGGSGIVLVHQDANTWLVVSGPSTAAPGAYVGQPAHWDGSAWVPLAPPLPLKLHNLQSRDGQDINVAAVDGDGLPVSVLSLGANVVLGSESGLGTVTVTSGSTSGTFQTAPGTESVQLHFGLYSEPTGALTVFEMGGVAGEATIAFFGVPLVTRPSITGETTQNQVDSLVAALVALGLATDDRV